MDETSPRVGQVTAKGQRRETNARHRPHKETIDEEQDARLDSTDQAEKTARTIPPTAATANPQHKDLSEKYRNFRPEPKIT